MKDKIPRSNFRLPAGIYRIQVADGSYSQATKIITIHAEVLKGPASVGSRAILEFKIPTTHWLFQKLVLACGYDLRDDVVHIKPFGKHKGLVGHEAFMCVRRFQEVQAETGEILVEKTEMFDFHKAVVDEMPAIFGDPLRNNGEPKGAFVKEMHHHEINRTQPHYKMMPMPLQLDFDEG